ncbi:MAG: hypothetical protein ACREQM_13510 [Candidatus Dormibacteraceae bacterium]
MDAWRKEWIAVARATAETRIAECAWKGQLTAQGGGGVAWRCPHEHVRRDAAEACAVAELGRRGDGFRATVAGHPIRNVHRGVVTVPWGAARKRERLWVCDHEHATPDEARLCAESEITRRATACWEESA